MDVILSAEARSAVRSAHTAGVVLAVAPAVVLAVAATELVLPPGDVEPCSLLQAEAPAASASTHRTEAVIRRGVVMPP